MKKITKPEYYELKMWLHENNVIGIMLEQHKKATLVKLTAETGDTMLADPYELMSISTPTEPYQSINDKKAYLVDYVIRLKKSLIPQLINWRKLTNTEEREREELQRLLNKYGSNV